MSDRSLEKLIFIGDDKELVFSVASLGTDPSCMIVANDSAGSFFIDLDRDDEIRLANFLIRHVQDTVPEPEPEPSVGVAAAPRLSAV